MNYKNFLYLVIIVYNQFKIQIKNKFQIKLMKLILVYLFFIKVNNNKKKTYLVNSKYINKIKLVLIIL